MAGLLSMAERGIQVKVVMISLRCTTNNDSSYTVTIPLLFSIDINAMQMTKLGANASVSKRLCDNQICGIQNKYQCMQVQLL